MKDLMKKVIDIFYEKYPNYILMRINVLEQIVCNNKYVYVLFDLKCKNAEGHFIPSIEIEVHE